MYKIVTEDTGLSKHFRSERLPRRANPLGWEPRNGSHERNKNETYRVGTIARMQGGHTAEDLAFCAYAIIETAAEIERCKQ